MTLPALMQDAQTLSRTLRPSTMAVIFWMFGDQRREERRWEWETCLPNQGFLAHRSQVEEAMMVPCRWCRQGAKSVRLAVR